MVLLKCLSNFWRALEMPLTFAIIFAITDTKLYVPVVTLSTQNNEKLLQQLKTGFKRTINYNKYHSKTEPPNAPNPYLDFLINPSFHGVNRLFVLPFNATDNRTGHSRYYLPTESKRL